MRARSVFVIVLTVVAAWTAPNVDAQDKAAYQQRSIARYLDTFALLDTGRNATKHTAMSTSLRLSTTLISTAMASLPGPSWTISWPSGSRTRQIAVTRGGPRYRRRAVDTLHRERKERSEVHPQFRR